MLKDRWPTVDPAYQARSHDFLSSGSGFGAELDQVIYEGPTALMGRTQAESVEAGESQATPYEVQQMELGRQLYQPERAPITAEEYAPKPTTPLLSAEDANAKYGLPGELTFDAPVREGVAKLRHDWKREQIERRDILARSDSGVFPGIARGAAWFLGQAVDPLNIASSFIPIVGQARYAAWAARYGRTGARALRGAAEGAVGQAMLEPFTYALYEDEGEDYTALTALLDITFGTALGGGLHVGLGAVGDAVGRLPFREREQIVRGAVAQLADKGEVRMDAATPATVRAAGRTVIETPTSRTEVTVGPEAARAAEEAQARVEAGEPAVGPLAGRTPEFRQWFGASKVVDDDGAPLVVYHGMSGDLEGGQFRVSEQGESGRGIYLTPSARGAERWAENATKFYGRGEGPAIVPVYASLRNPLKTYFNSNGWFPTLRDKVSELGGDPAKDTTAELQRLGFDGIIRTDPSGRPSEILAFRPEQIKSIFNDAPRSDTPNLIDHPTAVREALAPGDSIGAEKARAAEAAVAAAGPVENAKSLQRATSAFDETMADVEMLRTSGVMDDAEMKAALDELTPLDAQAEAEAKGYAAAALCIGRAGGGQPLRTRAVRRDAAGRPLERERLNLDATDRMEQHLGQVAVGRKVPTEVGFADIQRTPIPSDPQPDFYYHATSEDRARDIAASGKIQTHRPDFGTDQDMWPDGATEKRAYFTPTSKNVAQFAPEDGKSVVLRIPRKAGEFRQEGTGDIYSRKPVPVAQAEYLGDDGQWHPLVRPK